MNIPDIEAFAAVVEAGSIGGAAARLNLTQPAVTRRVQSLEQSLGATLLDRRSKPPTVTAAGRSAYDHARRVLRAVSEMSAALDPEGEPTGEFRIGVSVGLGDLALSDPVDRVRATFPQLHVRASTGWSNIQQVRDGTLDAAAALMAVEDGIPAGLSGERIATERGIIVAGADFKPKVVKSLAGLAAMPWVLNHEGCVFRRILVEALASHHHSLQPGVEAGPAELQLSLVARGHGLGLVLPRMLARSAFRDRVHAVTVRDFRPEFAICVIHSAHPGRLTAPIRCFRDALKEQLG